MSKSSDKRICLLRIFYRITILFLFVVSGCRTANQTVFPQILSGPVITPKTLGMSHNQAPIECYTLGNGPETILIIGAIHGNEPASKILCEMLIQYLQRNRLTLDHLKILVIPLVNPDGYYRGTRANASGIDLNRNFPTQNRTNNSVHGHKPLSEPESQILHNLILAEKPARICSIHQPYGCIDYDGPALKLAQTMGWYSSLPVKRIGSLPGSLGSWAGETLHIPTITLELTAADSAITPERLWVKYSTTLKAFLEGT